MASPQSPTPGVLVTSSRYRVERKLGSGSLGTVYLVRDEAQGSRVALKLLRPEILGDEALRSFQREFQAIASLRHPRIASAQDFGYSEKDGIPYYTREYVEGLPLPPGPPVIEGQRDPRGYLQPILDLLEGLQYLHSQEIIHLDIHAGNLIVAKDARRGAVLIDFGLPGSAQAAASSRLVSHASGLAPEILRGEPAGAATDIHAVGRLLLERITGSVTGEGKLPREIPGWGSRLTLELERIIGKAMQPDPKLQKCEAPHFRTWRDLLNPRGSLERFSCPTREPQPFTVTHPLAPAVFRQGHETHTTERRPEQTTFRRSPSRRAKANRIRRNSKFGVGLRLPATTPVWVPGLDTPPSLVGSPLRHLLPLSDFIGQWDLTHGRVVPARTHGSAAGRMRLDSPLGGDCNLCPCGRGARGRNRMLSIGEFSKVTSLGIKTIRLYHEKGLLPPAVVDSETGYRYYDHVSVERARVIVRLREMDFSLADTKEILESAQDEADIVEFLEQHLEMIEGKLRKYRGIRKSLVKLIEYEKEAKVKAQAEEFGVVEKRLEPQRIAGIRIRGKYTETGRLLRELGRKVGRYIAGCPFNLYYDGEYKEDDADFESCFPVRKIEKAEGVSIRELPGGRCISLIHRGPYEELGRSYEKIFAHVRSKGLRAMPPSREVYLKGPGMIFRGNPRKYLTEIQVVVEG